jgi:hypothetical protein
MRGVEDAEMRITLVGLVPEAGARSWPTPHLFGPYESNDSTEYSGCQERRGFQEENASGGI